MEVERTKSFGVIISHPETLLVMEKKFSNIETAARYAARAAGNGYIVEMNGKRYVPTTARVEKIR